MRLKTNARVTATEPQKRKMQQLMNKTRLTLCKEFERHNSIQKATVGQSKEAQLPKRV